MFRGIVIEKAADGLQLVCDVPNTAQIGSTVQPAPPVGTIVAILGWNPENRSPVADRRLCRLPASRIGFEAIDIERFVPARNRRLAILGANEAIEAVAPVNDRIPEPIWRAAALRP